MHAWIFYACNDDNGVNANTYRMLHESISLVGLLDLIEMKAVRDSWSHAELLNADERRATDARLKAALG